MPRISDFPIKSNPSTSATLSGVDGGENVQIPVTTFAKPSDIPSLDGYVKRTELQAFADALVAGEDADGNELTVGNAYAAERSQTAERLTVNAGSATQPVYFANGVPIATNLARVATSGSYNDLTDKPTIPSGGSGGGASIIDITDFPSNPSTSSIYRKWQVIKAELYYYKTKNDTTTIHIVNTLPEVGEMAYDGTNLIAYYNRADDSIKGYVDSIMSSQMGVPVGWYPAETLFGAMGYAYGGVVTSLDEATTSDTFYALVTKKPHLYCYHNNGSTIEKAAIITNDNYEFDEATGTLTQIIVL